MIILCEASNPQGTDVGNIINVRLPLQPNYTRKKVKTKSLTMGQQLAIKDRAKINSKNLTRNCRYMVCVSIFGSNFMRKIPF